MRRWGLYISYPRNLRETDQPFPEPALFLLNPDGEVHIVDYSNSPFARPDLRILIEGMHLATLRQPIKAVVMSVENGTGFAWMREF